MKYCDRIKELFMTQQFVIEFWAGINTQIHENYIPKAIYPVRMKKFGRDKKAASSKLI